MIFQHEQEEKNRGRNDMGAEAKTDGRPLPLTRGATSQVAKDNSRKHEQKRREHKSIRMRVARSRPACQSRTLRSSRKSFKKILTPRPRTRKGISHHGAVAQLGERLNGIQEVRSSILLSSTRFRGSHCEPLFFLHGQKILHKAPASAPLIPASTTFFTGDIFLHPEDNKDISILKTI